VEPLLLQFISRNGTKSCKYCPRSGTFKSRRILDQKRITGRVADDCLKNGILNTVAAEFSPGEVIK
jgi:hypothetical protein